MGGIFYTMKPIKQYLKTAFIILLLTIPSCSDKHLIKTQSIEQKNTKKDGLTTIKKIHIDESTILTQSFFGSGMPNELKLYRYENGVFTCLDSLTFFFHDEVLKPDTIHFNTKFNCYETNSEHSGSNIYGESIHFIQIKNNRFIQTFEQLKYFSVIDPESNPISTFSVETELILHNQNIIRIKGTIIQGIIHDIDSRNEEEISREIDTVEYHFNTKTSTYTYFNSRLPAYKEQWKNNLFL